MPSGHAVAVCLLVYHANPQMQCAGIYSCDNDRADDANMLVFVKIDGITCSNMHLQHDATACGSILLVQSAGSSYRRDYQGWDKAYHLPFFKGVFL